MDFQKGSYIRLEAQCGKELAGQPPPQLYAGERKKYII